MHRHVLFYSNYCVFSREVTSVIVKRGLRDMFVLVCVDKRATGSQLPDFVDRVPMVFTVDRRVLVDDAVSAFIESLSEFAGSARHHDLRVDAGGDDITPWSTLEMGSRGISDKFSFLDGTAMDASSLYSHNFVDVNTNPSIVTVEEPSTGGGGGGAPAGGRYNGSQQQQHQQQSLEALQAMRDNDIKPFMPPRAPANIDFTRA